MESENYDTLASPQMKHQSGRVFSDLSELSWRVGLNGSGGLSTLVCDRGTAELGESVDQHPSKSERPLSGGRSKDDHASLVLSMALFKARLHSD